MKFEKPLITGKLIRRYKRFIADIELDDGRVITAHVPNTGSMQGTDVPMSPVAISHHPLPHRKLKWTLEMVQVKNCWVGVNTIMANHIVEEAILNNSINVLLGYATVKREVKYGSNSRIDLLLEKENCRCYLEVKNVTYKQGNTALFPDAVTARGAKHLLELMEMVKQGHRAVMFYLVNRSDCTVMSPAKIIDPHYCLLLDRALAEGVEAFAYRLNNTLVSSEIDKEVEFIH